MSSYTFDKIKKMTNGDAGFLKSLAAAFVEEIPVDVTALEQAVENENPSLANQILYKLEPNFKLFGLDLSREIKKTKAWVKGDLEKANIHSSLIAISEKTKQVVKELKKDFCL